MYAQGILLANLSFRVHWESLGLGFKVSKATSSIVAVSHMMSNFKQSMLHIYIKERKPEEVLKPFLRGNVMVAFSIF